jgi:hypothetical protein
MALHTFQSCTDANNVQLAPAQSAQAKRRGKGQQIVKRGTIMLHQSNLFSTSLSSVGLADASNGIYFRPVAVFSYDMPRLAASR